MSSAHNALRVGADGQVSTPVVKPFSTVTAYTLSIADNAFLLPYFVVGGTATWTLPNSIPVGFSCSVCIASTGVINFVLETGASMHSLGNGGAQTTVTTLGRGSVVNLTVVRNTGGNTAQWLINGSLV